MIKFYITKEQIFNLLKRVSGIVDRKKISLILSCIKITIINDTISVTGADQSLEMRIIEKLDKMVAAGSVVVPFRQLFEICKTLPSNSEIYFEQLENELKISTSSTQIILKTINLNEFPEINSIETDILTKFDIKGQKLHSLLDKTSFAMADQDVRYYFNGMLFEIKNNMLITVAADGHRLAKDEISLSEDNLDVKINNIKSIIPRKAILEIIRVIPKTEDLINIAITKNHVQISSGNILFISSLVDGKFPEYNSVIPEQTSNYFIVHKESLRSALIRASALFTEKFRGVVLNVKKDVLTLMATNNEHDKAEEQLEIEYFGEAMEVAFNIAYLLDFLNVAESDRVKFTINANNSSNLLQDLISNRFCYVLMPVRI